MSTATNTALGTIKLAGDLAGNSNGLAPELTATGVNPGAYVLPNVTYDAKGRATSATNGTQSDLAALLPIATTTEKGVASFPASGGLTILSGAVSVVNASNTVKGVASFDANYFTVTNGVVNFIPSSIPVATSSIFGTVKTGENILNTAGVISVPIATSTVKGVASFSSVDFSVSNGLVSLVPPTYPISSSTVLGTAKVGANINVDAGVISVPTASSSIFGVVQTGENILNTAGVISVPIATSTVKGVASFSSSDFSALNGNISLGSNVAKLDQQNIWVKAQNYTVSPLTFSSTITPDFSLSNVFTVTATGNFTLANPTNVVPGTTYLIIVTQDATGGRLITWGSNFKFAAQGLTILSNVAAKRDIISLVAISSTQLLVTIQGGF